MSLKFKRNLPIIFLLVTFIAFLVVTIGNQHIISYSIQLVSY